MFTLTRLAAAVLMMLFMIWLAPIYDEVHDPRGPLRGAVRLMGACGFVVGWMFLGQKSKALWFSVYLGLQAVVMTGIVAAGLVAVRDIFVLGYRRQVREPVEAVVRIPEIAWDYLSRALVPDFMVTLAVGGVVIGLAVHLVDRLLDKRRLAR